MNLLIQESKLHQTLNIIQKNLWFSPADQIARATELQEQLFPNNSLQERTINFSELYLEFGVALIPELANSLDPLKGDFTIITI